MKIVNFWASAKELVNKHQDEFYFAKANVIYIKIVLSHLQFHTFDNFEFKFFEMLMCNTTRN